eukprot:CAMPEP_0175772566 /NCGR_PEP_ID=MMETSP0097-20121207/72617_1 /TAXON_ID=311494 /ORGANISM="Alexandrium monilatum, Strain CCMP3105" /LENGTH=324 /DNA_ID=CAMNT_0017082927 /DNA_START=41 /DNA_END=1013 /DNA_ORIENTATION=+
MMSRALPPWPWPSVPPSQRGDHSAGAAHGPAAGRAVSVHALAGEARTRACLHGGSGPQVAPVLPGVGLHPHDGVGAEGVLPREPETPVEEALRVGPQGGHEVLDGVDPDGSELCLDRVELRVSPVRPGVHKETPQAQFGAGAIDGVVPRGLLRLLVTTIGFQVGWHQSGAGFGRVLPECEQGLRDESLLTLGLKPLVEALLFCAPAESRQKLVKLEDANLRELVLGDRKLARAPFGQGALQEVNEARLQSGGSLSQRSESVGREVLLALSAQPPVDVVLRPGLQGEDQVRDDADPRELVAHVVQLLLRPARLRALQEGAQAVRA